MCHTCSHELIMQVALPTTISPRIRHTSVVFGTGPDFKIIVLFGGKHVKKLTYLAETTLLLFSE